MKIRIIIAFLVLTGFFSCSKNPVLIKDAASYSSLYIPQAAQNPFKVSVFVLDSTQTYSINAYFGGSIKPSKNINVTFSINPDMVDSFNAQNGTAYSLLPSNAYKLEKNSATIQAGSFSSESINIDIITTTNFPAFTSFILPVTIQSGDAPVKKAVSTIYFQVTASYAPGDIPRTELFQLPKDYESIFSYDNSIFEHAKSGEIYRFPYNVANNAFDSAVQLDNSGWGTSLQWLSPLNGYVFGMGVNGSPVGTAYGYLYVYKILNDGATFRMDGFTGNPPFSNSYDMMIPFKSSLLFRASGGNSMTMYNTNGSFTLGKDTVLAGSWHFNSIFAYSDNLFTVDGNGDLWQYPLTEGGTVGLPTKIGSGWDMYKQVFAFNNDLIGIDQDNKLWLYNFDIRAFWALKK